MFLKERIRGLPDLPGVYLMKGEGGEVIYIGKAKNLRSRVRSYFQGTSDSRYTVSFLVSRVADIDYIITENEKEALILEDTLLKRYRPRYNIRLKDDKTYVSVKLTVHEQFPRILITRRIRKDGSRYFGPYASARKVRDTIKFLRNIIPLRTCSDAEFKNRIRPCLDYQLGICAAPCAGYISRDDYGKLIKESIYFLEGRCQQLLRVLKKEMNECAGRLEFEEAGRLKDRILSIEETLKEQKAVSHKPVNRDVFSYAEDSGCILIKGMFIREGRLVADRDFPFHAQGVPVEELFSSFVNQYYLREPFIPDEVLLPVVIDDADALEGWLAEKKGRRVKIISPSRGERLRLLKMAEANAETAIKGLKGREAISAEWKVLLRELGKRLGIKKIPRVIEAFDISNIHGTMAVGAMVAFIDAVPCRQRYRLFKIRFKERPDDYAMMREVIARRYIRYNRDKGSLPDLILVDGGKGQLNITLNILKELKMESCDVIALAKDKRDRPVSREGGERVYLPNRREPIILQEGKRTDLLLRQIRDEVHRVAISYHKRLRGKRLVSILDDITGIGSVRRNALLQRFGTIEGIKNQSVEELTTVKGIDRRTALLIKERIKEGI